MRRVELLLCEETLLIALDDDKGRDVSQWGSDPGLAGALLLDLAARDLLDVDAGGDLTALDGPPPVTSCSTRRTPRSATRASAATPAGGSSACRGSSSPCARGSPRASWSAGSSTSGARSCWAWSRPPGSRRPIPGPSARCANAWRRCSRRAEPTPHEALLIGLLEPLELIGRLVPRDRRRDARRRAKAIAEQGIAGEAVRDAIRAVQAAVMTAVIAASTAAATSAST